MCLTASIPSDSGGPPDSLAILSSVVANFCTNAHCSATWPSQNIHGMPKLPDSKWSVPLHALADSALSAKACSGTDHLLSGSLGIPWMFWDGHVAEQCAFVQKLATTLDKIAKESGGPPESEGMDAVRHNYLHWFLLSFIF